MNNIIKKAIWVLVMIVMILSFSCCNKDTVDEKEGTTIDGINVSENTCLEAEKELKDFFEYYNIDFNDFENKGIVVISEKQFLLYENLNEEKYSYYVDIMSNDIYGGYPNAGMDCWWSNGAPFDWDEQEIITEETKESNNSYIHKYLGILDKSFETLNYQMDYSLFEQTNNQAVFMPFYIEKEENVKYYMDENNVLYGIENGEISVVSYLDTDGHQVKELINKLEMHELFEMQPMECKISNNRETRAFFYWKADNGYIGFVILGGAGQLSVYDCVATNVIILEDFSAINVF